jgi:CHAT domain-containing protein
VLVRWVGDDPLSRALIAVLNQLRDEYLVLYRLASEAIPDERPGAPAPAPAPGELADRERRMRAITEQLYLASGEAHPLRQTAPPRLAEVQRSLDAESLLIEFYNDGVQLWAFVIDQHSLDVYPLPLAPAAVDHLIAQLQSNIAFALKAGPASSAAPGLLSVGQRILQRLAAGLLQPLSDRLPGRRRLVVVPYGSLHYLPFHLLRDRGRYLIEDYEVVILPTAGLAAHRGPVRGGGARVLAYSWGQRLHATADEAEAVRELFGGEIYFEHAARRDVLQAAPAQILHIAAHGEYRLDRPELSYIELADGQLYTDDLFQQDLSYELVTLSACDTGRANVAAGDELIGLGRGFLYAGAGALIASLWRVADGITLTLMEGIYRALYGGAGKAAALRGAQLAVLASNPRLHPAFWGAFQLIGDPRPLSRELSIVQLGGNPCQVQTVA